MGEALLTRIGNLLAYLKSSTQSTLSSASITTTSSRQYAVGLDADGYLSVNVPWQNTNTTYSAGTGLSLSSTTFSLASGVVTAGSAGPTAAVSGTFGKTIAVPRITVDTYGRVTSLSSYNLTCYNVYPTTTANTSLTWNYEVLRGATATTAISASQPTSTSYSQEIHGYFLSSGTTCSFTVTNATVMYDGTTSSAGAALAVTVTDATVYEFSLSAMTSTSVKLLLYEWS